MTSVQERLFDVRDTRAVVTGAASGLGYAMAEVLAECGARVTVADINAERLDASTEKLRSHGLEVRSFVADVSEEDRVQALFDDVVEAQGGVDVVFANAGLAAVPGFRFDDGQTFERLLEEATLPIAPGDLFLLYTDGLTEAMNPAGDFFGEDRLSALVQSNGTAPFHQLRDEILSAISTFVGPAEQQDDMTMLLLRVQAMEPAAA